jgi:HEAT repeat protein
MIPTTFSSPSELLTQLIELERQHGTEAEGLWDIRSILSKRLDVLPTDEIFALIHNSHDLDGDEAYWVCISALRNRGDRAVFDACVAWATDPQPDRRAAAVDILAELGRRDERPFADVSLPVLEPLLSDPDTYVIGQALTACGKLKIGDPAVLAKFITHPEIHVRWGALAALTHRDDPISTGGLIILSRDDDYDIRNWATFGLGQMTDADSPEIRAALLDRVTEEDHEIRGEALIGLAKRGDMRVLEPLQKELAGEFYGAWCIEAAQELKLAGLKPSLVALKSRLAPIDLKHFGDQLDEAIASFENSAPTADS